MRRVADAGRVRVALAGCGWIARLAHIPSLLRSSAGRLVAIVEPDERARATLSIPGVTVRSSLDEVLDRDECDAIIIAAPSSAHADLACRSFAAGRHVYIEKPLATSVDDGRRIVASWRAAGTVGMVGFNFRHSALLAAARARLHAGDLGELLAVQTRFLWAAETLDGWRASPQHGGGVLPDLASHHVDLVLALTGESFSEVRCRTRSVRTAEDTALLEVDTMSGVPVQILVSFAAGAHANELELVGRRAALGVDLLDARARRPRRPPGRFARLHRAREALEELHPARLLRSPGYDPTFAASLELFLAAVRNGGTQPQASPEDGLYVLEVIDAARRSAATGGTPVHIAGNVAASA